MKFLPSRALARSVLAAFVAALALTAVAQDYPTRVVKIIVPFAPGGSTDYIGRLVAEKLAGRLGQPFVVENKPGGGSMVGSKQAAKSPPDGYTLLLASSSYPVNAALAGQPELLGEIAPVVHVVDSPLLVAVHPSLPVKTMGELIAHVKANPNKVSYSSSGVGSVAHLAGEQWLQAIGGKAVHVPYQGMSPAVAGIVSGDVQLVFSDAGVIAPMVKAGKVRAIAFGGSQRFEQLPDVPTAQELGMPNLMLMTFYGLFAPRGTPPEVIDRLNRELNTVIKSKEVTATLEARFMTPVAGSPDQFGKVLHKEYDAWRALIQQRGIKAE